MAWSIIATPFLDVWRNSFGAIAGWSKPWSGIVYFRRGNPTSPVNYTG
ncbi:hypothetical protein LGAA44_400018 [Leuconostoc gasicomitatum]|nr:hypothetical protein LGAA44_400018 [Leuconostoc gasicomitatum]